MTVNCKLHIRARILRAKCALNSKAFRIYLTASQIAAITNLNRNTINRYLTLTRCLIANFCERESPFSGEVECAEFYFGSRHQKGKGGRGAENKHIVFGISKRNGKVYTEIVKNVKAKTLQQIIRGKVSVDATVYTDGFRSYDSIVHLGYQKHFRIYHQESYGKGNIHINGIEGFWGYAKVRLVKFRGLSKNTLLLALERVRV